MAKVEVDIRGAFQCPNCGNESDCDPHPANGQTVVCAFCGKTSRVGGSGYMTVDWNRRNRESAKERRVTVAKTRATVAKIRKKRGS